MRTLQGKFGRGVIEAAKLFPVPGVVAGLAGLFGGMRIDVAPGAGLIARNDTAGQRAAAAPATWAAFDVIHVRQRFVAVGAQHGGVSVDQSEFRLRVTRQIERGRPEGFLRVAKFAAIFVRRGAEFAAMRIGVAIHADQLAVL